MLQRSSGGEIVLQGLLSGRESPWLRHPGSRAREIVLQVLYQDDLNPAADAAATEAFLRKRLGEDPQLVAFASGLLSGVRARRDELDELLAERAENWSLERMAATDRNVLRLGAYEILHTDTPNRVAIDEAVELAKRYGARQSAQFVNGILDRFMPKSRGAAANVASTPLGVEPGSNAPETATAVKAPELPRRGPGAEDFSRALASIAEPAAEKKLPAYFRTLLKTHCEAGAQSAAELAEAMGWPEAGLVLARYNDLGKRLGEHLHYDPPLYDASGSPLWVSIFAQTAAGGEREPETCRWELREEIRAALAALRWI